ncbi:MAG: hypothetical protein N2314_08845 [Brevinematales bacterium]|nr:hypothetical protein [Brevinematales bacterium]
MHEAALVFARWVASPLGWGGGLVVVGATGWWLGGWLGLGVGCGTWIFGSLVPIKYRKFFVVGLALVVMGWYGLTEEKIWFFFRPILRLWGERLHLPPDVVNVMVFFRPWYAGYVIACILWGVYRVYGKYPVSLWYRLTRKPLWRERGAFVLLSGMMLLGIQGGGWIERVVAGPWMVFLSFFVWKGVMTIAYGELGRHFPLWVGVVLCVGLMILLGEAFLVALWVYAGIGLIGDFFMQRKEIR